MSPEAHFVNLTDQWSQKKLAFLARSQLSAGPNTPGGPDCPQMSGRHPAGRSTLPFRSGVHSRGVWDTGTLLHETEGSVPGARPSCFLDWGTPLPVMSCRAQPRALPFPRTWSVDLCWRQMRLYALFSPRLRTPSPAGPVSCRLSRGPGNFRQSRQSLGSVLVGGTPREGDGHSWPSGGGRLLSFQTEHRLSPKILPSCLGLPHFCNWHHHPLCGSSPKPKSYVGLLSLTSHFSQSYHRSLQSMFGRDLLFSISTFHFLQQPLPCFSYHTLNPE